MEGWERVIYKNRNGGKPEESVPYIFHSSCIGNGRGVRVVLLCCAAVLSTALACVCGNDGELQEL